MKLGRHLRAAGTVLLGLAVGLAIAEIAVRLYFAAAPARQDAPYIRDRAAGYRLRPDPPEVFGRDPDNYTSRLGFRDREHSLAKPEGVFRILGIGDSFVYGSVKKLADHFLKVAEREIGSASGDSAAVEMIMMGVGGYSPVNEVGVLKAHGLRLKPDLVILNFFVGNDVTAIRLQGKVLGGQWYPSSSPYPWLNLLRKSDAFLLVEKMLLPPFRGLLLRLYVGSRHAGSRETPGGAKPQQEPAQAHAKPAVEWSDWYLHAILKDLGVFETSPDTKTQAMWREAEECLEEFDRLCDEANVPWILLLIPAHVQLDPAFQRVMLERFGLSAGALDFDAPQRRLHAFARARGIPVIDPLEEMRRLTHSGETLCIPNDGHWNIRGNRVVGERLAAFVTAWRDSIR